MRVWRGAWEQGSLRGSRDYACLAWQVNCDLVGVREWLAGKMGEEVVVDSARGMLTDFIVERFVPHQPEEEHYVW